MRWTGLEAGPSAGRRRGAHRARALAAGAALVLAAGVPRCPPHGAGPAAGAELPERHGPVAGGAPPPELRAVAERVAGFLPPHARLERLALTPRHVVLGGHVAEFDGVADLLESLARIPGIEEPDLRRAIASERGVEFGVVLAASPPAPAEAGRTDRDPPAAPAYASIPVRSALGRLLFPPST